MAQDTQLLEKNKPTEAPDNSDPSSANPTSHKASKKKDEKPHKEEEHETLIRILSFDIPGSKNILTGLTKIKGISWTLSNAICVALKLDKFQKISELPKSEILKIQEFIKNPNFPDFLKNRRSDPQGGLTTHETGSNLDMKKEFDVKLLKKIRSYKGVRHTQKLPVRGQRTRANFRKGGTAVGVIKKSHAPSPSPSKK
jgi:small subunit ribosomal protein S13